MESLVPRTCVKGRTEESTYEMFAANGTTISDTYGIRTSTRIHCRRGETYYRGGFPNFGLLVDLRRRRLLNTTTSLVSTGRIAAGELDSVRAIESDSDPAQSKT